MDDGQPSAFELNLLRQALRPFEALLQPRVLGIEHIPTERPLMFVGNHQLLALDSLLLVHALWREAGIWLRPLADDFLFRFGVTRLPLGRLGVLPASVDNCAALLRDGQCVLVYPGGAREAAKEGGARYQLQWWDRLGFARIAVEHGCTIVPVASYGLDQSVRVLWDGQDYLRSPLGRPIAALGIRHDMLPPVFVPRRVPQLTYALGRPIHVRRWGMDDPETAVRGVRSEVARAVMGLLPAAGSGPPAVSPAAG